MANSDGNNGSLVGKIIGSLDNKIIFLLVASAVGVSGNQFLFNPRPDPWTGTQAREAHKEFESELKILHSNIEQLKIIIYSNDKEISILKSRMHQVEDDIDNCCLERSRVHK